MVRYFMLGAELSHRRIYVFRVVKAHVYRDSDNGKFLRIKVFQPVKRGKKRNRILSAGQTDSYRIVFLYHTVFIDSLTHG